MLKNSLNSDAKPQFKSQEKSKSLSVSTEIRVSKQLPIPSQQQATPKLKGIFKKSPSILITVCSKCKTEESLSQHEFSPIFEKEVEVKKERKFFQKRIQFDSVPKCGSSESNVLFSAIDSSFSKPVPTQFLGITGSNKSSIIGNNDFWLPPFNNLKKDEGGATDCVHGASDNFCCGSNENIEQSKGNWSELELKMIEFFHNIFKETTKIKANILQVITTFNGTVVTLTNEYVFECKPTGDTFEISNAVSLKDVQNIMVNDTCTVIILEVCLASSITEYKEFVPGYPEKTEQLISWIVYGLSRIRNSLPDVIRLPLLLLPNYKPILHWVQELNDDEVIYTRIVLAEKVSETEEDSTGESFMIQTHRRNEQFRPMILSFSKGKLLVKCIASCNPETCDDCSVKLELKDCHIQRNDDHRPNSVLIKTSTNNITVACSSEKSADNLVEKLYRGKSSIGDKSKSHLACILVTGYYLQMFNMLEYKKSIFGSPILNLSISNNPDTSTHSCYLDAEGIEADCEDFFPHRWNIQFLDLKDKYDFMFSSSLIVDPDL